MSNDIDQRRFYIRASRIIRNRVAWRTRANVSSHLGPCLEWQGGRSARFGYGRVRIDGYLHLVHRLVAELYLGLQPGSPLCVLHHCDNPACCRPSHLFIGTRSQNIQDAARKGRTLKKLTISQRRYIKQQQGKIPAPELAKRYKVRRQTIEATWKSPYVD